METQQKLDELDKAISWWQKSLEKETSALQQEAKEAIVRKLKHERRKLKEEEEGSSLEDIWQNVRDTAIETYDDLAGHLAETINEFLEEEQPATPAPPSSVEPNPETKEN